MSVSASPQPRSFWSLLLICALVGGMLASAMGVSYQVFLYRETFQMLQVARKERERLDIEWGRLLIEQQAFGATTQIGGRAVMTLRMYAPPAQQTVILRSPPDQVMP
ncbi:MAG: cell division protein FtsL [Pseudomonadota bacterium]|nr:cell division protein FtsL [Pseudomonadota bacterium]